MTTAQAERVRAEWSRIAGEAIDVEEVTGTIYGFGSELATLRLYRKFSGSTQGWSGNLRTWYFTPSGV